MKLLTFENKIRASKKELKENLGRKPLNKLKTLELAQGLNKNSNYEGYEAMSIIISRHGEVENVNSTIYGNDYEVGKSGNNVVMELSEVGKSQWRSNLPLIQGTNINRIITSSNIRSIQSAEQLSLGIKLEINENFDEYRSPQYIRKFLGVKNSQKEMRKMRENIDEFVKSVYNPWNYSIYKDTETPEQIIKRSYIAFMKLLNSLKDRQNALIISHNLTLRFLTRKLVMNHSEYYMKYPENEVAAIQNDNFGIKAGGMKKFDFIKEKSTNEFILVDINDL